MTYLRAIEDFKNGEPGFATENGVNKLTSAGIPKGAILVTALEDIRAGENGNFHEWRKV